LRRTSLVRQLRELDRDWLRAQTSVATASRALALLDAIPSAPNAAQCRAASAPRASGLRPSSFPRVAAGRITAYRREPLRVDRSARRHLAGVRGMRTIAEGRGEVPG